MGTWVLINARWYNVSGLSAAATIWIRFINNVHNPITMRSVAVRLGPFAGIDSGPPNDV